MTQHATPKTCALITLCLLTLALAASARSQIFPDDQRKQERAVRVSGVPSPDVDGRLDDPAWSQAVFVSDFLQKEPDEGAPPTDSTWVGVLYDDNALYIGARMFSDHPELIRGDVNRRDEPGNAEQIILSLDTYLDRRTSYDFCVSASGVRMDRIHPTDDEHETEYSYNVVWEGHSYVDSLGWTAEMRIPFSQLRFNNHPELVWGINWNRWIPARNEDVFWIYTPRQETGWASRFGDLVGLNGITPSRRLELLPYVSADGRYVDRAAEDPFDKTYSGRAGGDLKMGLGPNLTLDATINPDFGQVEADPAEVNLSAYETYFDEKRPFFIEGSQLLEADGPDYYYSRRIGGSPHGQAESDFVDAPNSTTIPAAAKITGRLSSGLSIGALAAVTGREQATTYDSDSHAKEKVDIEPPTAYGVLRLQQEFGEEASAAGIILTGVGRDLKSGTPLADQLHKEAFSGGADWSIRFKDGMYQLEGFAGFSHVRGDTAAIFRTQRSSTHYYQRPDAGHIMLDPTRTSLSGYTAETNFSKETGRHWLWGGGAQVESPGFEINDLGILNSADDIDAWANIRYRETTPGDWLRGYTVGLYSNNSWNFGGVRTNSNLELDVNTTWRNYWSTYFYFGADDASQSDDFTRGGPLMRNSASFWTGTGWSNNYSSTTHYAVDLSYSRNELGGWGSGVDLSASTRGRRWQVTVSPGYNRTTSSRQYITTLGGGPDATFGKRYIFSWIDRSTLSAQVRLNYFFTPDLSLEVYAEPFAASGRFFDHGELRAARTTDIRVYHEAANGTSIERTDDGYRVTDSDADTTFTFRNSDFGVLSFRSNVVIRWEFRPGSTFYFVWQQNREGDDRPGQFVRPRSLWDSLSSNGENFVAVKISYWIPVS